MGPVHFNKFVIVNVTLFEIVMHYIRNHAARPTPHPVAGADEQPVQYYTITVLLKQCIFFKGQTQNDVWL